MGMFSCFHAQDDSDSPRSSLTAHLKEEVARLRAENAALRADRAQLQQRLGATVLGGPSPVLQQGRATYATRNPAPSSSIFALAGDPDSLPHMPSDDSIKKERRLSLGEIPTILRAENATSGVLPLAAAFDRFDRDRSGGITLKELVPALEYLGVAGSEQAAALVMQQYDKYPDKVLDVKEVRGR